MTSAPPPSPEPVSGAAPPSPRRWRWFLLVWRSNRNLRRVCVLTAGTLVIIVGVIISPLPGPGLSILGPIGLGILASEFLWAKRLAHHAIRFERVLRNWVYRYFAGVSRLLILPALAAYWAGAWLVGEHTPAPSWMVWAVAFPAFTPVCYVAYRWAQVRAARRQARRTGGAVVLDTTSPLFAVDPPGDAGAEEVSPQDVSRSA